MQVLGYIENGLLNFFFFVYGYADCYIFITAQHIVMRVLQHTGLCLESWYVSLSRQLNHPYVSSAHLSFLEDCLLVSISFRAGTEYSQRTGREANVSRHFL